MYRKSSAPVCSSLLVVAVLVVLLSACSATDEAFATADWIPDGVTSTSYGLNMPGSMEPYLRSESGHAEERRLGILSWLNRTPLADKLKAKFDGQEVLRDSKIRDSYKKWVKDSLTKRSKSKAIDYDQLLPILSRDWKHDVELAKTLTELKHRDGGEVLKHLIDSWARNNVLNDKVELLMTKFGDLSMTGEVKIKFQTALGRYANSHPEESDKTVLLIGKIVDIKLV